MFNILIVGHGEYATGVKSLMSLLLGDNKNVHAQNLNEDLTHDEFEKIIDDYIEKYEKLIVFADISGGAPSQIVTRKMLTAKKSDTQYIISGVPVSAILDISMKVLAMGVDEEELSAEIENSFNQCREMMTVFSTKDI